MVERTARGDGASKVMATLEILSATDHRSPDGMTVAEVARALDRDKSVASRQLKGLAESGLVERDETGRFRLSWRLFTLMAQAGDQRLIRAGIPLLRVLAGTVRDRAHLSVLSGQQVLTVHTESSTRSLEAVGWVGRLVPIWNTSSGIALVMKHDDAHIASVLDELHDFTRPETQKIIDAIAVARSRGYAVADGLFEPDLMGIAAPVHDGHDRIVAAVNVSGPTFRVKPQLKQIASHVVATATKLSAALVYD
ncbi:IclR family transcriptional regulator [Homoserinimonas sp. A520]